MPKEPETKLQIQARFAEDVQLRTAERLAQINDAYTHKRTSAKTNVKPITKLTAKKNAKQKLKNGATTDRGRILLENTKTKMRAAQDARTRRRIEELDYEACEALGKELLKDYWDLHHELVAQAEEPWSDDEDAIVHVNFKNTNVRTEENSHCASYAIYPPAEIDWGCESSSAKTLKLRHLTNYMGMWHNKTSVIHPYAIITHAFTYQLTQYRPRGLYSLGLHDLCVSCSIE
jgi:hypothetical protein